MIILMTIGGIIWVIGIMLGLTLEAVTPTDKGPWILIWPLYCIYNVFQFVVSSIKQGEDEQ
jgi:hypothetical protein